MAPGSDKLNERDVQQKHPENVDFQGPSADGKFGKKKFYRKRKLKIKNQDNGEVSTWYSGFHPLEDTDGNY